MNQLYKISGLFFLSAFIMTGCNTLNIYDKTSKEKVSVYAVSPQGVGEKIGTVILQDTKQGLQITTDLTKIPSGPHGFHIHEYGSCQPAEKNGQVGAALAAGGHFNPNHAEHHGTPLTGHLGDLPLLTANTAGDVKTISIAPRLKLSDIRGHAIMVHAGGDNYSDTPAPLGGGGGRIACGVI
ncbi:superoxide dismutase family protein [Acinetobacter sp. B10A]|uniref:superoxide dismutase family protein n=1 Tax=Acinetobacter baretiae TaxID=2605383 RepID=UPI001B3C4DFB|nr:superoxide dismutase family protein [Acinetobacter baretiae]MBF7686627.1 superoxide dismutase family protein [Acinetobacter baretiae]